MAQVLGHLPLVCDVWMELQAPDTDLAQPVVDRCELVAVRFSPFSLFPFLIHSLTPPRPHHFSLSLCHTIFQITNNSSQSHIFATMFFLHDYINNKNMLVWFSCVIKVAVFVQNIMLAPYELNEPNSFLTVSEGENARCPHASASRVTRMEEDVAWYWIIPSFFPM